MSVSKVNEKPETMAHFPDEPYRFYRIHDDDEDYGSVALAERGDDLELHVTLTRWGPSVRRALRKDVEWLNGEARRLGKKRVVGMRFDSRGDVDMKLFRFAALFGFTEQCVVQTAAMAVHDADTPSS